MEHASTIQCSPPAGGQNTNFERRIQMRRSSGQLPKSLSKHSEIEIPIPQYWIGLYGGVFSGQKLRLRLAGNLQGPRVLVLGGISSGRFVTNDENGKQGWWG